MNRRTFIKSGALFVPMVFIPRLASAQFGKSIAFRASAKKAAAGGGEGGGYVLGVHGAKGSSPTDALNTTGATLIVVSLHYFSSAGSGVTDNKGNTYTALTATGNSGSYFSRLYYCVAPTVGSGHTWSSTADFVVMHIAAFAGNAGSPFDAETGAPAVQPGSITPAQSAEVFVTATTGSDGPTFSIDSTFNILEGTTQSSSNLYGGMAYKIKTDSAPENPSWSAGGGSLSSSVMAAFK